MSYSERISPSLRIPVCLAGCLLLALSGCGSAQPGHNNAPSRTEKELPALNLAHSTDSKIKVAMPQTPTPAPDPSPTATIPPSPTPTLEAMPLPVLSGPPYIYHTIEPGETLGFLADWYGAAIEELVLMNQLAGPEAIIQVNQLLRVPIQVETFSPSHKLLPDSEVVYGPGYVGFDITAFVNEQGGYLASYEEYVEGEALSGGQIIERVAEQFSVGPRLLLALLEYYGQWVTNPTPNERQLHWPLGDRNPREGLFRGLEFTANRINAGYYGYKRDGFWIFRLPDRSQAITPVGLNAGTVGVQNILSLHADQAAWQQDLGPTGFLATYQALFGDPAALAIEPLIPITLRQPPLTLPWRSGQGFYLTGGPHPAFVDGSGWAAVDFGPPDVLGNCFYSAEPNTAAAAGVVVTAKQGEVQLDLDGDGQIQTGWVLFYLHVALDIDTPLQVGQRLQEGEVIGYASCEGGLSNSSHLHFARRYNGEWIAAAGPIPLEFSGWVTQPGLIPYAGGMTRAGESRTPCECWEADVNLIIR